MNTAPINVLQGSHVLSNEVNYPIDRIDAPLTPRRKLVVPAVFESTKQSYHCNTPTKPKGRPNKLKIPVAFSSPTSCKSDPATWSPSRSSSPKNKLPKTPALGSPSKDQGVTVRPSLDVPLAMEDDIVVPTTTTTSTPVENSLPTIESANNGANVAAPKRQPTLSKSRSKKQIRTKQRQLAREEQKKALMLQLLSLNQKIEAVKLERSTRQLAVEDIEVIELIDDDDESVNAEDECSRLEQVKVISPAAPLPPLEPGEQNTEHGDGDEQQQEVVEVGTKENDIQDMVDDQPDCAATEEHGKTRKIRKINRKRLVKLGSFFARRRQREQNIQT